ncbi:MAG TPA: GNAT family N-acetyltransferase [Dyella sp.]|nr:GNAT family N-acetyltransferase [Dyella sp.]
MHDASALALVPVDHIPPRALLALRVAPEQQAFVGRVADLLADAQSRPTADPLAFVLDDEVIGLCCIERQPRTIAPIDFGVPAVGLRGFFIDLRWQGRGLGRRALALLLDTLAQRHPAARLLVLSVDRGNAAALGLYRQAGFVDGGERYHGAPLGARQCLLLRALDP